MGAIIDRAEALAVELRAAAGADVRVTTEARNAVPPCILVVPVPTRVYNVGATLSGSYEVRWEIVALAPGAGDLEAARNLEDLVDLVASVLDVDTATPTAYQTPGAEQSSPAYILTLIEYAEA